MKALLSLLVLTTTSAFATSQFTGEAKLPKGKEISELAIAGTKYAAIKSALKLCHKSSKRCGIEKVEILEGKAVALASPVAKNSKEQHAITVDSGDYLSTAKFSATELNGIVMNTIEKALEQCRSYGGDSCELANVQFHITNDQYYDFEWNDHAYKTHLEVTILAIN